jgi:hypothetical protein
MKKEYLYDKAVKKKTAYKYLWIMVVLGIVFVSVVIKFALAGRFDDIISSDPSSDDVYAIAKIFVKPTLRSDEVQFSDSEYQFGKQADSVYVIKSSAIIKDAGGQDETTHFEVILRYKGGARADQNNWDLVDMKED